MALLKDNPFICKQQFALISIPITVVFYIADVVQRVPVHRAILRSQAIEEALRQNNNFDSPRISEALGGGSDVRDFFSAARKFRVWSPYLGIITVIMIIFFIAP